MEDGDNDLFGVPDDLNPAPFRRPVGGAKPKFQPKLKIKGEPSTAPPPIPSPLPSVVKEEKKAVDEFEVVAAKPDEPQGSTTADNADVEAEPESELMDIEEEDAEDTIVREIDVFFNPIIGDASLYVMQYPLRPSWRPYELNERCEEVRVSPNLSKMEVELSMDVQSDNYDRDVADHLRLQKQTLYSSKATLLTDYAVGIMMGDRLHLNPINAVVQLRTSLTHVSEVPKRKLNARSQEVNNKSSGASTEETLKQSRRQQGSQGQGDLNVTVDDAEPWIPLHYHGTDSDLSSIYQQKMMGEGDAQIEFTMKPYDYINSLCPGSSTDKIKRLPRRYLLSLPLEERLKKLFSEICQVNRFVALLHLAPSNSSEEVLEVLTRYADLVQGLWVTKSSLLYEGREGRVRDYILFLFSKKQTIGKDKLKVLKISDEAMKRLLRPLAVERPKLNDWKFKEATDDKFKKQYPQIVAEQEQSWSSREKDIMDSIRMPVMKNAINPNMPKRAIGSVKVEPSASTGKGGEGISISATMPNESTPKALLKLFQVQRVHSLKSITREMRDMALSKSSLWKEDPIVKSLANAGNGVLAPSSELKSAISQHTINIHGLYVLKSVGIPALDSLRNVVINLFLKREPNAKIEKWDIEKVAKDYLKREISELEYNQVLNELCSNNKGAWMVKTVD